MLYVQDYVNIPTSKILPHQDIVSQIRDVNFFLGQNHWYSMKERKEIWTRFYQLIYHFHIELDVSLDKLQSLKHVIAYLAESHHHRVQ